MAIVSPSNPLALSPRTCLPVPRPEALALLSLAGDIFFHAERGAWQDIFSAYGRLVTQAGREVTAAVPPRRQPNGRPLIPFSAQRISVERVMTVYLAIGQALRNANATDAERHWTEADATMRGFAQAEAIRLAFLIADRREDIANGEDTDDARADVQRMWAERERYELLAAGEGWA